MVRNYIRIAFRNILKHKFYSFINIFGLTVGVSTCMLIGFYIVDELGYDAFHKDVDNIYRIGLHGRISGREIKTSNSCPPLADAMVTEVPGVDGAIRLWRRGDIVFRYDEKAFAEDLLFVVDSNFFDFFSFKLVEGDPKTALLEPNSIVLTEDLAMKYFNNEDPIGKTLVIGNQNESYEVTGLAENPPGNSHIKFSALMSMTSMREQMYNGWTANFLYTYYRKNPETAIADIDGKLDELVRKYVGAEIEQFMGVTFEQFEEQGGLYGYVSYPILDTHLRSSMDDDMEANGDITYVYIFAAIGLFILLIACINFMNLSTARSAGRAKEVGMRKTLGSYRQSLIFQFLIESVLYSLIAVTLAVGTTYLILPLFNMLSGKMLVFEDYFGPVNILLLISFVFVLGLMAGSYPAFYLTAFKPAEVLRGKIKAGMKSRGIRSGLVIFQFWVSIILIICTAIVYRQLQYMQQKNLGFDKHNVLIISNMSKLDTDRLAFKKSLEAESMFMGTSYTNNIFPGVNNTTVFRDAHSEQDHIMGSYFGDYDHLEVLQFELAEGRFFSRDFPSDSSAVIINEAAVEQLGWDDPLSGELVSFFGDEPETLQVIGVVKDFNFESLHSQIRPITIGLRETMDYLLIRYVGESSEAVEVAGKYWDELAVGEPFEYSFLDQSYDVTFRAEQRLGSIFSIFTALAIFIACLGLFGLASFMAEQRTKEIGIRKVMGASVSGLTTLVSREFAKLVLISFVLAVFPSYYFMNMWLEGFAYRQEPGIWIFIVAGLLSLIIASITVGFQALKVALSNPVSSLKYE